MQISAGSLFDHHRERLYFAMIPANTTRWYFWYRLATPMQIEKEDQIDYLLRERGIDPAAISLCDSFSAFCTLDHLGGAALFQMLISCYPGSS